jgi:hypothetical protein
VPTVTEQLWESRERIPDIGPDGAGRRSTLLARADEVIE